MKIYAKFPHTEQNVVHLWTQPMTEQIIETVGYTYDMMKECIEYGDRGWVPARLFPFFIQEDIHSRWVTNLKHDRRSYIVDSTYELLFLWEPEDFYEADDEEDGNCIEGESEDDCYKKFNGLMKEIGLKSEEDIKIPDEFVYLGRYLCWQKEPLTLPGFVGDPEQPDGEGMADCMFKYIDVYTDFIVKDKHIGMSLSLPYDDAIAAMHLFDEASSSVLNDIRDKDEYFKTFDFWFKDKAPELYKRMLSVWKQTAEEDLKDIRSKNEQFQKHYGIKTFVENEDISFLSLNDDDICIGRVFEG